MMGFRLLELRYRESKDMRASKPIGSSALFGCYLNVKRERERRRKQRRILQCEKNEKYLGPVVILLLFSSNGNFTFFP